MPAICTSGFRSDAVDLKEFTWSSVKTSPSLLEVYLQILTESGKSPTFFRSIHLNPTHRE